METTQIVWLALMVVFVVLEAVTAALVSIWFCAGALVALLIAAFWPAAVFVQVLAFFIVSAACLLALRPLTRKLVHPKRVHTNADANIGKVGQVTAFICPGQSGKVKLNGQVWSARSDAEIPIGRWCRVQGIEGVTLLVVPASGPLDRGENEQADV